MIIVGIEIVEPVDVVYDIETSVGTFLAGSMKTGILVKNTDSCYAQFPIHEQEYDNHLEFMKAEFDLAKKCAAHCTKAFKQPIELEFEKYMYPLALFAKKRYAYLEWTDPEESNTEIEYKGLQIVRRDVCRYVKEELGNMFNIIMYSGSKEAAYKDSIEYLKKSIQNLLDGNLDVNKLVLSKQLKANYVIRKNKESNTCYWTTPGINQPHVHLAQMLMSVDPVNHPRPPDRVPYLYIQNKKSELQYEKVVHPSNFNSKCKIDSVYYFEHQYQKVIHMLFELMISKNEVTNIYSRMVQAKVNEIKGQSELLNFFKTPSRPKETIKFTWNPELTENVEGDEDS